MSIFSRKVKEIRPLVAETVIEFSPATTRRPDPSERLSVVLQVTQIISDQNSGTQTFIWEKLVQLPRCAIDNPAFSYIAFNRPGRPSPDVLCRVMAIVRKAGLPLSVRLEPENDPDDFKKLYYHGFEIAVRPNEQGEQLELFPA